MISIYDEKNSREEGTLEYRKKQYLYFKTSIQELKYKTNCFISVVFDILNIFGPQL